MNYTHLFLLFGFSALFIIVKVILDWKRINVEDRKGLEDYIINTLLFKSFTNTGLVLYGIILVFFLISQISTIDFFHFFADNIAELSLYVGGLSFYMIIKGFFGLLEMFKCKTLAGS